MRERKQESEGEKESESEERSREITNFCVFMSPRFIAPEDRRELFHADRHGDR